MLKNGTTVRFVPDRPGLGGSKTGIHTQIPIADIRDSYNAVVYNGRWRKMVDSVVVAQSVLGVGAQPIAQAMHVFSRYSTTDPTLAPTNNILVHYFRLDNGTYSLDDVTAGTSIYAGGVTHHELPATFLTIKNRCFICNGSNVASVNIIYDGVNPWYPWGVAPPATAATYTYASTSTGTTTVTHNCASIVQVSGTAWHTLGLTGKTVIIGGSVFVVSSAEYHTGTGGDTYLNPGNASALAGNPVVTITGSWPTDGSNNGLTLNTLGGALIGVVGSYTVSGGNTTVQLRANAVNGNVAAGYYLGGERLNLNTAFGGVTAWAQAYTANYGTLTWSGRGPQYAYCYYDPATGHISNASPITTITEQNQGPVTITLSNIQGFVSTRFTKILIFRTLLSGGSVLFPIGDPTAGGAGLINNPGAGVTTFTDSYTDDQLIASGTMQLPQLTNNAPPVFAHMVYWDGRVWGNPVNDPSAIRFSGDSAQILFGVPEECFPSTNVIRIPAEDGRVTGMKLLGNSLIITTAKYAYYVIGNNELNYRLLPFSTTLHGVSDQQMIQIGGESVNEAPVLLYMGNDYRVYAYSDGSGSVQISQPVQDKFDALSMLASPNPTSTGLQQVIGPNVRWVAMTHRSTSLVYDYENKVWIPVFVTGMSPTIIPFASTYSSGTLPKFYFFYASTFDTTIRVYQWADFVGATAVVSSAFVRTPPMDFGRKSIKQLNFVRIHVSGLTDAQLVATPWTCDISVDDGVYTIAGAAIAAYADSVRTEQGPQSTAPIDSATSRELIYFPVWTVPAGPQSGQTVPLKGHRFQVTVNWPSATNILNQDLLSVDISVTDVTVGEEVEI